MACNAKKTDDLLITRFFHGLDGAIRSKNLVQVILATDAMELPCIKVVCLKVFQRLLEQSHGAIVAAIMGLAGEVNLLSASLHHFPDIGFADSPTVSCGGVNVVYAKIEGAMDDSNRLVFSTRLFERCLAAQTKQPHIMSGFPKM